MKRLLLALITTSLFAACGSAFAADDSTLQTIVVRSGNVSVDCTPPSDVPACAALGEKIRANFNPREIEVLFGARTASAEALTAYPHLEARYTAFMRGVDVAALTKPAK